MEFPKHFSKFDVLLHRLGHDLVPALELVLKSGDSSLLMLLGRRASSLEGCVPGVEERFVPVAEHRWLDLVLVAQIGLGNSLEYMPAQNGNLLHR